MPKFSCNNCGNTFTGAASAQLTCPACGSNSVVAMQEQKNKSFWLDKRILILVGALLLMIIVLFFLRTPIKQYEVYIEPHPDSCMIKIIVKAGNHEVPAHKFLYKLDQGAWTTENEFLANIKRPYYITVKLPDDSTIKFNYNFSRPYDFNPTCEVFTEKPCDCKKLLIKKVENKQVGEKNMLIITATPFNCPKEYSIDGEKGPFSPDSIINLSRTDNINVFVRMKDGTCPPSRYFNNPYIVRVAAPSAKKVPPKLIEAKLNSLIKANDQKQEAIIKDLLSNFESESVKIEVNNNKKTIVTYLSELCITGQQNKLKIAVTRIGYSPVGNKINQLTIVQQETK
jgi:hypothetical protein